MDFANLVLKARSYRRFDNSKEIGAQTLEHFIDLARQTPSAANLQPLKYLAINDKAQCQKLFPLLGWAGYLADWDGPCESERPAAYIVMLHDTNINAAKGFSLFDHGIAAQTILLAAAEQNLGGCFIGNFKGEQLAQTFALPQNLKPVLVIALGVPAEKVKLEPLAQGGGECAGSAGGSPNASIKYWRDENSVHHVPKRALADVLYRNGR